MKKIMVLLAALAMFLGTIFATAPAHAGWPGAIVVHAADDSGYNPPVFFVCEDNGRTYSLGLGVTSRQVGCQDVQKVWAGAGDLMKCKDNGDVWWHNWYGAGYYGFGNFASVTCYQQKA